jgi:hypothetical protein
MKLTLVTLVAAFGLATADITFCESFEDALADSGFACTCDQPTATLTCIITDGGETINWTMVFDSTFEAVLSSETCLTGTTLENGYTGTCMGVDIDETSGEAADCDLSFVKPDGTRDECVCDFCTDAAGYPTGINLDCSSIQGGAKASECGVFNPFAPNSGALAGVYGGGGGGGVSAGTVASRASALAVAGLVLAIM